MKKNTIILIAVLAALAAAVVAIVLIKSNARKGEEVAADASVQDTLSQALAQGTSITDSLASQVSSDTLAKSELPSVNEQPEPEENAAQSEPQESTEEPQDVAADPISQALATGRPVLADFGRSTCIPCKKMLPILTALKKEYAGRAEVLIIDIDEHMELTQSVGIRVIPTQIFYDSKGNEVSRHVGFMGKDALVAQLAKMGVN